MVFVSAQYGGRLVGTGRKGVPKTGSPIMGMWTRKGKHVVRKVFMGGGRGMRM